MSSEIQHELRLCRLSLAEGRATRRLWGIPLRERIAIEYRMAKLRFLIWRVERSGVYDEG